jgi:hypothetical protein
MDNFRVQLDEINQIFMPNSRNKLLWFYQEVDEPEAVVAPDPNKPSTSRAGVASITTISKTPQGSHVQCLSPHFVIHSFSTRLRHADI